MVRNALIVLVAVPNVGHLHNLRVSYLRSLKRITCVCCSAECKTLTQLESKLFTSIYNVSKSSIVTYHGYKIIRYINEP